MGEYKNWTTSWENSPTALSNPGEGDDQLRNLKTTIRTINAKEHNFSPSTEAGALGRQGTHKQGSAAPFVSDTEPLTRVDGNDFEADYDEGRLWIDIGSGGKMMYLSSVATDGTPTWKPLIVESVGKIEAFASQPNVLDRWLPCDGRLITNSQTSPDLTENGFSDLVDMLVAEAGANTDHPYYGDGSTSAYIPDFRGVVPRGLEDFSAADYGSGDSTGTGNSSRDTTSDRYNPRNDTVGNADSSSGSHQADGNKAHDHDSPLTTEEHSHTFDWEHTHPVETYSSGIGPDNGIGRDDGNESHTTYTTELAGKDGDTTGLESDTVVIPSNGNNEVTMKNVGIYWFIKY